MGRLDAICISARKSERKRPVPHALLVENSGIAATRMPEHGIARSVFWLPRTRTRRGVPDYRI